MEIFCLKPDQWVTTVRVEHNACVCSVRLSFDNKTTCLQGILAFRKSNIHCIADCRIHVCHTQNVFARNLQGDRSSKGSKCFVYSICERMCNKNKRFWFGGPLIRKSVRSDLNIHSIRAWSNVRCMCQMCQKSMADASFRHTLSDMYNFQIDMSDWNVMSDIDSRYKCQQICQNECRAQMSGWNIRYECQISMSDANVRYEYQMQTSGINFRCKCQIQISDTKTRCRCLI